MSGPFGSSQWMYSSGDNFYNGIATQSLKFDSNGSAYLSLNPAPTGDSRKKFTFSCWVKRCAINTEHVLFSAGANASSATGIVYFYFTSSDTLAWYRQFSGSADTHYITSAKYLDVNSWYHVVLVEDANTTSHKIYVNGVEQAYATTTAGTNTNSAVGSTEIHTIGRRSWTASSYLNGYMAEVNFLDNIAVGETDGYLDEFGELKNGVWIPKAYTGSYGTAGYRLEFKDNTNDSANSNNYTANNVSAHDYVLDCPELNFCTLSALHYPSNIGNQLLDGGLVADATASSWSQMPGAWAFQAGEKWYWEACASNTAYYLGCASQDVVRQSSNALIAWDNPLRDAWIMMSGLIRHNGANQASISGISSNTVVAFAVDVDAGTLRFYINNVLQYTASDDFLGWYPDCATINSVYMGYNFGQDSTFSGIKSSGSANATDENGYGDFYFTPPSGYLAMCSANLSTAEGIDPAEGNSATDYFGILTWSGDDNASRTIASGGTGVTGDVNFTPDFSWIKRRNGSSNGSDHLLLDIVRGVGSFNGLSTNGSSVEGETAAGSTWSNFGDISAFATDGFTVQKGSDPSHTLEGINQTGGTYVGWNWKAGGTGASNESGTIISTVSVATEAGFSIATWSGNSTSGATIGHGLSSAPNLIITKCRSHAASFVVGIGNVPGLSTNDYLSLNSSNGKGSSTTFYQSYTTDTNTTFQVGVSAANEMNKTGKTYVSWCFTEIDGYSRFGIYKGNGTSGTYDGSYVYTGFRPSFVLIKPYSTTGDWELLDNTREPFNDTVYVKLEPNNTGTDSNRTFFMFSNGFKVSGTGNTNASGVDYLYIAFAENPFEYANGK